MDSVFLFLCWIVFNFPTSLQSKKNKKYERLKSQLSSCLCFKLNTCTFLLNDETWIIRIEMYLDPQPLLSLLWQFSLQLWTLQQTWITSVACLPSGWAASLCGSLCCLFLFSFEWRTSCRGFTSFFRSSRDGCSRRKRERRGEEGESDTVLPLLH